MAPQWPLFASFISCACGLRHSARAARNGYTEYVVGQYAQDQQGNVGVIAMKSGGEFAVGRGPTASSMVDSNTVFEVGSTTKIFATLAAEMLAGEGKVSMNDTIAMHLPTSVNLAPAIASITLIQLATHTSGLAQMPNNYDQSDPDPMRNYHPEQLYEYLSSLTTVGPKSYSYSNTGSGLLGLVTSLVSGKGWEALVRDFVLEPLGMRSTAVALSTEMQARLAPPYRNGSPSGPTSFTDSMVAAGGMRSTAPDMLKFAEALAGLAAVPSAMRSAMDRLLVPHAADNLPHQRGMVTAGGLQQYMLRGRSAFQKDGATSGYNCMISFVPGVAATVVMANTAATSRPSSAVLAANLIQAGDSPHRSPIPLSSWVLQRFTGSFVQSAGAGSPSIQYSVSIYPQWQSALYVRSSHANPVTVVAFQYDGFFTTQTYLETYHPDPNTLVVFHSGKDHFAARGPYASMPSESKDEKSLGVLESPFAATSPESYVEWLHSRSFSLNASAV